MKITAIRAHPMIVPLETTFWVGTSEISSISIMVVEVETDGGLTGLATVHRSPMKVVAGILDELQSLLIGMDPLAHEKVWARVFTLTTAKYDQNAPANNNFVSEQNRGNMLSALAAIDLALWDIKGKAAGLPVWKLIGGQRSEIPAYVTGGYYRADTADGAIGDECAGYIAQGYSAVKIKIGAASIADDARRIEVVRQAIGRDAELMIDANGAYSLTEATQAAQTFAPFGITWFEEPLHWHETATSLGELARRIAMPIACGESELHAGGCRDLIDYGGIRFMQFDAARYGGATEWLRVAAYCDQRNVAMTTHHAPHIHGHLAAGVKNGLNIETFPNAARDPVFANLYPTRAQITRGRLKLSDDPGFGFSIDWNYVKKHRLN